MTPRLLLRCGCDIAFDDKDRSTEAPICPTHGNQSVVRVLGMPKPRIRGCASGPLVKTEDLTPFVGKLTGDA